MKHIIKTIALLIAWSTLPVAIQAQTAAELESLYQQIDEAIGQSKRFVNQREEQINKQRQLFRQEKNGEKRLMLAQELFALYKPYKNDSALHYAQECITLADSLGHADVANRYRSLMARQCSNAGMYVESKALLDQVDKAALDRQGMTDYYDACMHVCGEIAAYSLLPEVRANFYAMQDHYRDSVLSVADEGSDEYLHLQMSSLVARQEYQEALAVSDKWLNKTIEGTHDDAYATYYRHIVYDKLGNAKMTRYWLAKSALDDIRCAVMDQASLITLAQLLNYDGDLERSYSYIRFTWNCNQFFNTRIRASQISPVLDVIEKNYQDSNTRSTRLFMTAAVVFCLMSVILCIMFLSMRRQKRALAAAHEELRESNERYVEVNHKLQWMNDQVTKYNKQLFEEMQRTKE